MSQMLALVIVILILFIGDVVASSYKSLDTLRFYFRDLISNRILDILPARHRVNSRCSTSSGNHDDVSIDYKHGNIAFG